MSNHLNKLRHTLNIKFIKSCLHASGCIKPAILMKTTVKQQKEIKKIIKNARFLGLIKTSYI